MSEEFENEDELLNTGTDDETESQGDEDVSDDTDSVEDEEEVYARKVAKRIGWVPPEEWTGEGKPKSASEFLEGTVKQVETLKERVGRLQNVTKGYAEEVRRKALAEAETEVRRAVRDGDEDGAVKAYRKAQEHDSSNYNARSKHPWVQDEFLYQAGVEAINRALRSGKVVGNTVEEQLDFAEKEVRKRYSDYFDDEPVIEERAAKAPSTTRQAPVVQSTSRQSVGLERKKAKGWSEMPLTARKATANFVESLMDEHGMTVDAARDSIAINYWRNVE